MEDYPHQYVEHNLPVVALSGIGQASEDAKGQKREAFLNSSGTKITVHLPELPESLSAPLRKAFQRADGSTFAWNGDGNPDLPGLHGFKCYNVGRSLSFPRRKAAPAPQAPSEDPAVPSTGSTSINHDLHSPLSPLSPTSSLFPDGLMTPLWLDKHQREIASVLLCFLPLSADPSTASLKDNELKNEITSIRTSLSRSGFRTRLAVVLACEQTDVQATDLEERISIIRRSSGLDAKSSFFVLPEAHSEADFIVFALNVLSALQPVCVDYYRDLTKHARRKKSRGFLPPPTGASARGSSASLSFQDWHARYEFKQGVFAEFRQEMDVAERHYTFAVDELFNPEGALENTPTWSARWNEVRELADVTALRVVRCLLWRNLTTGAVESWSTYRDRTKGLVDRRAKGTMTYGFAAWESRWAECMAQLIHRAQLPVFRLPEQSQSTKDNEDEPDETWVAIEIMARPEKAFAGTERQPPFRLLHHAGYWYRMARKWAMERYQRASIISDEDRVSPDATQPSALADRRRNYDTYMVPPPHEELPSGEAFNTLVLSRIEELDLAAGREFASRRQFRARSQTCIERSQILSKLDRLDDAFQILVPVWNEMSWRSEHWWDLAANVILELYNLAHQDKQPRLLTEVKWEMMRNVFGTRFKNHLSMEHRDDAEPQTPITLSSQQRLSPVVATFSFAAEEGHVGDTIPCQLALVSATQHKSPEVRVRSVQISFNGGTWVVALDHTAGNQKALSQEVIPSESGTSGENTRRSTARADLSLEAGITRVFNLGLHLREVGELTTTSIQIEADFCGYQIHYTFSDQAHIVPPTWWLAGDDRLIARSSDRDVTHVANVLPKPPRLQVMLAETKEQYLTSDEVVLELILLNEENDAVSGTLKLDMADNVLSAIDAKWLDLQDDSDQGKKLQRPLPVLGSYEQRHHSLSFKAPAEAVNLPISVSVDYVISNDPDAPVQKTNTFNFKFVAPFDLDFELHPLHDPQPWPSFFSMPSSNPPNQPRAEGIRHRWSLSTRLTILAVEALQIESLVLKAAKTSENVTCDVTGPSASASDSAARVVAPRETASYPLEFYTRKLSLEDRRPASLSLALGITWRRQSSTRSTTTTLAIPTLHIPAAEPRVLCTAGPLPKEKDGEEQQGMGFVEDGRSVRYTLENPSLHHLTFTLAMDASDAFAFSGPKSRALALTPLSRVDVVYRILALVPADGVVFEDAPPDLPLSPGEEDVAEQEEEDLASGGGAVEKAVIRRRRGRWVYPVLRVQDAYFMKSLRVLDAGPGVRPDSRRLEDGRVGAGVGVWVPTSMNV